MKSLSIRLLTLAVAVAAFGVVSVQRSEALSLGGAACAMQVEQQFHQRTQRINRNANSLKGKLLSLVFGNGPAVIAVASAEGERQRGIARCGH